ncbi:MAG: XrtA/PEP-CTERM system histidine kinase PrsK [bacterium]
MTFDCMINLVAAGCAAALMIFVLIREPRSIVRTSFTAGLFILVVESVLAGLSAWALMPEGMLRWQAYRLVAISFMPPVWILFSLVYARGNYQEFLDRWRSALRLAWVLPLFALAFMRSLVTGVIPLEDGLDWAADLGTAGMVLIVATLVGHVIVLMNLERTLRASTGTMRWRIKFMVFGLGLFFAVRIYSVSQSLLYSSVNLSLHTLSAGALIVACLLMFRSLLRSHLLNVDLYLSHRLIFSSFTVIAVGVYLLVVGVMAQLVTHFGGAAAFPLKAFLVFIALIGLVILLQSDRARLMSKRFVSRHFNRPLYDYRQIWAVFTERTASLTDREGFNRALTRMVSETFDTLSVTLWMVDETRGMLVLGSSTSMSDAQARELGGFERATPQLITALRAQELPVDLDRSKADWVDALRLCNPDYFRKGGTRLCMPINAGGELLGIMIIGDRVNGFAYSVEDFDLLKTICDQAAAKLLSLRLSERLLQAREMEAFQTMSAFFVHDLKNTASTLSLMLQNLPRHFEDPAFREDALKAMGKGVGKINDVIRRLTMLRQKLEIRPRETDLNDWLRGVLSELERGGSAPGTQELGPVPSVRIDPEQMQNVVTNLVLNAREAVRDGGSVRVTTAEKDGWATIAVSDTGCGMTREFVEKSLFRPFQSTKKEGMGIGLFHSKMIVEAHCGRMEVESEPGRGSTFRVLLPLARE